MNILALIASFGGGAFAALIGALPAFIMTGFVAFIGAGIGITGAADLLVNNLAFGSFFGPHISFAGAVAATAYAGRKYSNVAMSNVNGKVVNGENLDFVDSESIVGSDITYPLCRTKDYTIVLLGGVFGVIGYLIQYLYANVLSIQTDTIAMTVATLGIIVRLVICKTGILTISDDKNSRKLISRGNEMMYNICVGLVVGIVVSYIGAVLMESGIDKELVAVSYPSMCFGLSTITLIFAQFGSDVPATHYISLTSANAFVLTGSPVIGIIVAVISALLGDFIGNTVNSSNDSHIDPPACTIFIVTLVMYLIF